MTPIIYETNIKKSWPYLYWVLKARGIEKSRDALTFLNVDSFGFCCTDGRRLHLCEDKSRLPVTLENGLYKVIVSKDQVVFSPADPGITFPDYKAVISKNIDKPLYVNMQADELDTLDFLVSKAICEIYEAYKSCLNIAFVKDLEGFCWNVHGNIKPAEKVKFTWQDCIAMVCPIRLKNQE